MAETTTQTDMGVGLGLVFALVAVLAALAMYLGHADHLLAGWAFGVAVVAGGLSIVAVHVFDAP